MSNNERKIRIALSIALISAILWAAFNLNAIAHDVHEIKVAKMIDTHGIDY